MDVQSCSITTVELLDESEEADGFVPVVEPEASVPVMPPLAPDASMIERALFSLVHVKIVPSDLTLGIAKHCCDFEQVPLVTFHALLTQLEMAFPTQAVVGPVSQGSEILIVWKRALSPCASSPFFRSVAASSAAVGADWTNVDAIKINAITKV